MLFRSRRDFLKGAFGALAGASAFGRFGEMTALAANPANNVPYQALVCIFLAGGNDGHNTVFPIATTLNGAPQNYSLYQKGRQSLALPNPPLNDPSIIYDGANEYALHPKLTEIAALYRSGAAAVIANVGNLVQPIVSKSDLNNAAKVPSQLYSHSDQVSQWQSAIPNGSASTGWGGRAEDLMANTANANAAFSPITSTSGCGLFCTGQQTFASTVPVGGASLLIGTANSSVRLGAVQQLMTFDNGLKLVSAANANYNRGVGFSQALNTAIKTAKVNTIFPGTLLGQQLLTVAKIISIRAALGIQRQVFFCQLGGFDTHSSELGDQDGLLAQLSPAVNAFYLATQELAVANEVTAFTASEFGRTLQPNGNGGTDHAWGSHHFVIGGSVLGGKFYGQYPRLDLGGPDDANTRGTLIPTTSIAQYVATMAAWFGVDSQGLEAVSPFIGNFSGSQNLGFLG
jgi:uncharacterized protein (DUF1501 family)